MKKYYLLFLALFCAALAACSPNLSSNTLAANEVGTASQALPGTIIGKRVVNIDNNSGVGGLAGAGTGAVAGSTIGGGTTANLLGGIGGAVVGGVLGNQIDKSIHAQRGYEYFVRLNNRKIVSVTQAADTNLGVGQKVLVILGPRARLIPTNG